MSPNLFSSLVKLFFFVIVIPLHAIGKPTAMKLSSPAFSDQTRIPVIYTAQGKNISPPLTWTHTPEDTVSFVLICEDPDAPGGTFDHWILYNIPASFRKLPQNFSSFSTGMRSGLNSWGKKGYGGPNPSLGTHRYIFTLYALDILLDLAEGVQKEDVLQAMQTHVLAQSTLMGLYGKKHL